MHRQLEMGLRGLIRKCQYQRREICMKESILSSIRRAFGRRSQRQSHLDLERIPHPSSSCARCLTCGGPWYVAASSVREAYGTVPNVTPAQQLASSGSKEARIYWTENQDIVSFFPTFHDVNTSLPSVVRFTWPAMLSPLIVRIRNPISGLSCSPPSHGPTFSTQLPSAAREHPTRWRRSIRRF